MTRPNVVYDEGGGGLVHWLSFAAMVAGLAGQAVLFYTHNYHVLTNAKPLQLLVLGNWGMQCLSALTKIVYVLLIAAFDKGALFWSCAFVKQVELLADLAGATVSSVIGYMVFDLVRCSASRRVGSYKAARTWRALKVGLAIDGLCWLPVLWTPASAHIIGHDYCAWYPDRGTHGAIFSMSYALAFSVPAFVSVGLLLRAACLQRVADDGGVVFLAKTRRVLQLQIKQSLLLSLSYVCTNGLMVIFIFVKQFVRLRGAAFGVYFTSIRIAGLQALTDLAVNYYVLHTHATTVRGGGGRSSAAAAAPRARAGDDAYRVSHAQLGGGGDHERDMAMVHKAQQKKRRQSRFALIDALTADADDAGGGGDVVGNETDAGDVVGNETDAATVVDYCGPAAASSRITTNTVSSSGEEDNEEY